MDTPRRGGRSGRGRSRGVRRGRGRGRGSLSFNLDESVASEPSGAVCTKRGRGRGARRGRGPTGPSMSHDASAASFSMEGEIKKIRAAWVQDKKNIGRLSADQKKTLLELREQNQVATFLLPDAPAKKTKRKSSPVRISCPLATGIPATPPPKQPRPWEGSRDQPGTSWDQPGTSKTYHDVIEITHGPTSIIGEASAASLALETGTTYQDVIGITRGPTPTIGKALAASEDVIEGSPTSLTVVAPKGLFSSKKIRRKLTFSPSTGILTATSNVLDYPVVEAEIEMIGFSPSPTPLIQPPPTCPGSGSSTTSSIAARTYDMQLEDELGRLDLHPGSDVEEDPAELVDIRLRERSVNEYPSTAFSEEVDPAILKRLEAMDAEDDAALGDCVTQDMLRFEWSSDPNSFKGKKEIFTGNAGPTFSVEGLSPLEIFQKIWDTNIMSSIVRETNRYAHQIIESSDVKRESRIKRWQDVNEQDMWTFFAIIMLQSFVPNPVESEYWYPKYFYLKIGKFSDIMSFKKFLLMKKCLHFVDNLAINSTAEKKLAKIQPVLDHLNEKFSTLYTPEQTIAIDESLLMWKGKLSFAQLISNKHAKVGIKSYELCESRTGYLWKIQVYSGKSENQQELSEGCNVHSNEPQNATSQIVLNLMRPLLHKGYVLVMDNFYNSPLLSRALKLQYQTDTIGTLRLNRIFVPDALKSKTKTNMRAGEVCCSQTSDLSVVVWRDNNLVAMISTYHIVEVAGREKYGYYKYKPKVVLDYNLSMGGVDKKDQLLHSYPVERVRNAVWYKKLFRRLLNVSIHNAYVLFNHHRKTPVRNFRMRLADEILTKYSPLLTKPVTPRSLTCQGLGHFPKKNIKKQRCKLCARAQISRRTVWKCEACNVNLCIEGCFKDYHTQDCD